MKLFISLGPSERIFGKKVIEIEGDAMMWSAQYKAAIEKQLGIPIDMQRLIFAGCELIRPHSGLQKESTIHLIIKPNPSFSSLPLKESEVEISPKIAEDLNRLSNQKIFQWKKISNDTIELSFKSKLDIYCGQEYKVLVQYANDYPHGPFRVQIITPIYHPRVNMKDGSVRLSLLQQWDITVPDTRYRYGHGKVWHSPFSILDLAKELEGLFSDFAFQTKSDKEDFFMQWLQPGFEPNIKKGKEIAKRLSKGYSIISNYNWTPEAQVALPLANRKQIITILLILHRMKIFVPNEIKFQLCQKMCESLFGISTAWDRFSYCLANIDIK